MSESILILPLAILAVIGVQGRKSFLFSYPAVFVSCETACIDRAKRSVSFKDETAVSGNSRKNIADGNVKREKRRVAEIGSEVEELKRKLKEARKSEKLEKKGKTTAGV